MARVQPGQEQMSWAPILLVAVLTGLTFAVVSFSIQSYFLFPDGLWQALWELLFPPQLNSSCFAVNCGPKLESTWARSTLSQVFLITVSQGVMGSGVGGFIMYRWLKVAMLQQQESRQVRGSRLAESNKVNALVPSLDQEPGPHIQFGSVKFPRYLETLSMLTCGSPGTGKSTVINQALYTLRQRSDNKAIIYDANGDYLKIHYRPGDVVLGFSGWSTHTWTPWGEFPDGFGFENVVEVFIPESGTDTFWSDSARTILTALMGLTSSWSELQRLIYHGKIEELIQLSQGTEAHRLLSSKEAMSILTGMASRLSSLRYLQDASSESGLSAFNFRQWASNNNDSSWVFLVVPDEWQKIAKPIITVYFDVICQATFKRAVNPTSYSRLWLIIDELASLGYLPRLEDFLSQGRKYGGCAFLGFQLISQLRKIYDVEGTNSILGCCQSKLILRTADGETCKFLAELIGQKEYYESKTSVSKEMALEGRRTTTQSFEKRLDYVVLPSQISTLPRFNGLLVMPELPVSQIVTDPTIGRGVVAKLPEERPVKFTRCVVSPDESPVEGEQPQNQDIKQPQPGRVRERTKGKTNYIIE